MALIPAPFLFPLASAVIGWFQLEEAKKANEDARAATTDRYDEARGVYRGLRERLFGEIGSLGGKYLIDPGGGLFGQLDRDSAAAAASERGFAEDTRGRVLGEMRQLGRAEARDVGARFNTANANIRQQLASTGLGNTTIAGTMGAGLTRQRVQQDALLRERLRQQMATTDIGLSQNIGNVMARSNDIARQNLLGRASARIGLGGDRVNLLGSVQNQTVSTQGATDLIAAGAAKNY